MGITRVDLSRIQYNVHKTQKMTLTLLLLLHLKGKVKKTNYVYACTKRICIFICNGCNVTSTNSYSAVEVITRHENLKESTAGNSPNNASR